MNETQALAAGWLGTTQAAFRAALLAVGQKERVPAGAVLYQLGDAAEGLVGVMSGCVRLHVALNGQKVRIAHICGPGFWLGEYELLTGSPWLVRIEAPTETTVMKVAKTDFLKIAEDDPTAWRWIASLSAENMAVTVRSVEDLLLENSEERLVSVLLRLAGRRPSNPAMPPLSLVPVIQSELAEAANMSRRSAGQILRKLEAQGAIALGYGAIEILDPAKLETYLRQA